MKQIRTSRTALLAAGAALALAVSVPLSAAADPLTGGGDILQQRVEEVLAKFPGGVQIGANEIAWDGGNAILTLEVPGVEEGPLSVGSCDTNYYCAYSGVGLSGSKISFYSCGVTYGTGAVGTVRSVANARTTGYVDAKNATGGILATIWHDDSAGSVPFGITQLTCVS